MTSDMLLFAYCFCLFVCFFVCLFVSLFVWFRFALLCFVCLLFLSVFPWLFGCLVGGCCCSSTAHARIAPGGPGHRFSVFLWVTNVLGWKFTVFDLWDSQALETRITSSIMSYFNLIQFHRIAWEKATGFLLILVQYQ